jgi:hypothetical protein
MKKTIYFMTFCFLFSCNSDSEAPIPSIVQPTNLSINAIVSADNSGLVSVAPKATNADKFTIDWGDGSSNTELDSGNSSVHTYSSSGSYDIKVIATNQTGGEATITEALDIVLRDMEMDLPVTYEDASVNYTFANFGGAVSTMISNPHKTGINTSVKVASFLKPAGAETWAGTTLELANNIDFSSPKLFKVLIWSPKIGTVVKLKVENINDPTDSREFDATTTVQNEWEELSYIFGNVSQNANYSKLSIFLDFGKIGDNTTYFFDNITIEDTETTDNGKWQLTFQDEFEGNEFQSPNLSLWEAQSYNRRDNPNGPDGWWDEDDVYLSGDGNLVIRVRKIGNKNNDNDTHDYSVGMVRSKNKFEQKFGKFEIKCQLPKKSGWWVAFWLFSDGVFNENGSGEDGREIDIMEAFGWTDRVISALHYDGYGSNHRSDAVDNVISGVRDGFHTFSLEWDESGYIFL